MELHTGFVCFVSLILFLQQLARSLFLFLFFSDHYYHHPHLGIALAAHPHPRHHLLPLFHIILLIIIIIIIFFSFQTINSNELRRRDIFGRYVALINNCLLAIRVSSPLVTKWHNQNDYIKLVCKKMKLMYNRLRE